MTSTCNPHPNVCHQCAALVLTVLVVSGIVLTDIAALRQPGDMKNDELSMMASYFDPLARRDEDSLARRDGDSAAAGPLAGVQLALGASLSLDAAREEVSEESSMALGGGLEDARRRAADRTTTASVRHGGWLIGRNCLASPMALHTER